MAMQCRVGYLKIGLNHSGCESYKKLKFSFSFVIVSIIISLCGMEIKRSQVLFSKCTNVDFGAVATYSYQTETGHL